ncbi:hypothetical protein G7Y89_g1735 [Cudoniella acicularis]|uniref:Major facilitator superfamily (MFS) profile domain-containing protein n=1 Tax=Cudoniella acicularis TaxID=354080 RepID=A0A8H4RVS4_9HELO|nr:hypothetical protein G7Y89_g1735 [Cudoniella acicularis]
MSAPKNESNGSGSTLPENETGSRDVDPHGTSQPSQAMAVIEPLPELHTPHRKRRLILWVGVVLATLDLCCLPITYYYALKFGTHLSLQDIFAIITGVYGLLSFTHYFFRSLKLFRSKTSPKWRPLEFLQVNILIVITLVEIELVAGTAPNNPIVRLVAMPSPTICFYLGFLFCGSAVLTQMRRRLPFNMSSTPKGSIWRPALLGFIEDAGGIEGQGGVQYREALMKRYEVSPRFRRMVLILSWVWGLGFIVIAIVATVLIMLLDVDIGFGLGWGLPWVFSAVYSVLTIMFIPDTKNETNQLERAVQPHHFLSLTLFVHVDPPREIHFHLKMGMWILESRSMEHVPGTNRYFDDPERPQAATSTSPGLKCDTSGPVPIILVPQPSDDPNDPLNWPLWKRDFILFILSLVSIFATCLGPILAADTLTLSLYYRTKFTNIATLTGWFLLGVGVAAIFFVPSARIWGKRHLFLVGTVILVFSSAWAGASGKDYNSLVVARVFQGIGTAPFETLVNAAVGDLYFVHERGKRMAFTNLAVFGSAFFTPILVGKITHTIGWAWSFYFVAIFAGLCLPLVVFFVPETAYRRSAHLNTDMASSDDIRLYKKSHQDAVELGQTNENPTKHEIGEAEMDLNQPNYSQHITPHFPGAEMPKKNYTEMLMPFSGRKSDESFWKLFIRPFPLFAHPAIMWACLIQGTMIGWTVFIGIILAAIFLGPPLFWDEVQTGYAYTGAFIGAIMGFLVAGILSDWSAKYMTRKNGGIYEPEFRIVLVIPQLIFGCTGLYLFGVGGMVIGAVAASLYLVDAHRDIAIEAFTCTIIFKNFFSFGLTFSAYNWLVKSGTFKTFMWISSIQVFICLLSIPMYV